MSWEAEYTDDFCFLKKCRYEDDVERDITCVRPLGRFASELVRIYFISGSKVRCVEDESQHIEFSACDLDDLLPSLGQQVGATVHHFQIIHERAIPVSFARSTGPIEPPKRPFIAAILAVLVQAFILEYCGILIPPSRFDFWFNMVMETRASPISYLWLDAKVHIARCFAQNAKVSVFGQGIMGEHFKGLQRLSSFCKGVEWMVHTSTGVKLPNLSLGNVCNSTILGDFNREGYLWRLWNDAFFQITSSTPHSMEQRVNDAKTIFTLSVERAFCLASQINKVFENNAAVQQRTDVSPDILLLASGTCGEYAAICFFSALRFSLSEYFSGVSTTKLVIEHSSDIMATLLYRFLKYYTFLTPSKRQQNLFDECQGIWQYTLVNACPPSYSRSEVISPSQGMQNRASFVLCETVLHNTHTHTSIINEGTATYVRGGNTASPLFSHSVYTSLYCSEIRTKLAECIQLQAKLTDVNVRHGGLVSGESLDRPEKEKHLSSLESSKSIWAVPFDIDWCTLELFPLEEETETMLQNFLRNEVDAIAKQTVYSVSESQCA